jgi:hypothetical protein
MIINKNCPSFQPGSYKCNLNIYTNSYRSGIFRLRSQLYARSRLFIMYYLLFMIYMQISVFVFNLQNNSSAIPL